MDLFSIFINLCKKFIKTLNYAISLPILLNVVLKHMVIPFDNNLNCKNCSLWLVPYAQFQQLAMLIFLQKEPIASCLRTQ